MQAKPEDLSARLFHSTVLLCLVLVACSPQVGKTAPTDSLGQDFSPSLEAFDASEKCPYICWLGINPGMTSAEQAHDLLRASDQIDQKTFHVSKEGIGTIWFTEKSKRIYSSVGITFANGLVKSVSFDNLRLFKMGDFINLIGEPDEISIRVDRAPDAEYISYMVYYGKRKTIIWVLTGSNTGPEPTDPIQMLIISTNLETPRSPNWLADFDNQRQRWLGYGHVEDYLPGVATPVSDLPTP